MKTLGEHEHGVIYNTWDNLSWGTRIIIILTFLFVFYLITKGTLINYVKLLFTSASSTTAPATTSTTSTGSNVIPFTSAGNEGPATTFEGGTALGDVTGGTSAFLGGAPLENLY